MASKYVRSTDGSDSDTGATWALAYATLDKGMETAGAGDYVYVSQSHSNSVAAGITIAGLGTLASPQRVICADDTSGEPPTTLSTGAIEKTTGANSISITGTAYFRGMTFISGESSNSSASIVLMNLDAQQRQMYDGCTIRLAAAGGSSTGSVSVGGSSLAATSDITAHFNNCAFKFGATDQKLVATNANMTFTNCSFESGSSSPAFLFSGGRATIRCDQFDFSNLGTGFEIASGSTNNAVHTIILRNCKFPSGWDGSRTSVFNSAGPGLGSRVEMYDYIVGTTEYRLWVEDYAGVITQSTSIYCDSGASEGTGGFSWKLASSANSEWPILPLTTPEIVTWIGTTGSKTLTVEFAQDSAATALNSDQIVCEWDYLGTASSQFGTQASTTHTNPLTSGSAVTTSTATWTGLTTPTTQKFTTSVTVNRIGYIRARIKLGLASKTVYVNPKITVA